MRAAVAQWLLWSRAMCATPLPFLRVDFLTLLWRFRGSQGLSGALRDHLKTISGPLWPLYGRGRGFLA